jgi:hypothetical protein
LFSFLKKSNKNKGLILGSCIQLARHLPFVGIIQIRFNGYVLSLTAPLRDGTKVKDYMAMKQFASKKSIDRFIKRFDEDSSSLIFGSLVL